MLRYELKRKWKEEFVTLNKCYLWQMIDLYPEVWNNCVDDTIMFWFTRNNDISLVDFVAELTDSFIDAVNIHLDDIESTECWVETGNITAIDIKQILQIMED